MLYGRGTQELSSRRACAKEDTLLPPTKLTVKTTIVSVLSPPRLRQRENASVKMTGRRVCANGLCQAGRSAGGRGWGGAGGEQRGEGVRG